MITKDGRTIISGHYSTEEERNSCLSASQWEEWKKLEKSISEKDTGSKEIVFGHNRDQQSILGKQGDVNPWGQSEGTIGNTIDYCVQLGIFTKEQIKILAGTRLSKVNSHLRSREKKGEYVTIENEHGIVSIKA